MGRDSRRDHRRNSRGGSGPHLQTTSQDNNHAHYYYVYNNYIAAHLNHSNYYNHFNAYHHDYDHRAFVRVILRQRERASYHNRVGHLQSKRE
ncbi:hypothetical protein GCM10007981_16860 [Thermocladium modestius]|uniref:Uncharacterized protein n=1 Tax=Thermocladium modestius TaxID=62609 RepID=A0A830GX71_9CREN|nr:hypothetical protein GCM10007981_16860 [Thermocladium modestius]